MKKNILEKKTFSGDWNPGKVFFLAEFCEIPLNHVFLETANLFWRKTFSGDWDPENVHFCEKVLLCFPSGLEFGESFGDFVSFFSF